MNHDFQDFQDFRISQRALDNCLKREKAPSVLTGLLVMKMKTLARQPLRRCRRLFGLRVSLVQPGARADAAHFAAVRQRVSGVGRAQASLAA